MSKILKEYVFTSFGFPVLLHNIEVQETECGDEYPNINLKVLEKNTAKALIRGSVTLTGVKLKFLRKFLKMSLRELGRELNIPHSNIKLWEDNAKDKTGLEISQEKQLKYLVLLHIQMVEQKELSKSIFEESIEVVVDSDTPLEIDEYKYGT